jgi:hypothetical protein
MRHTPASLCPDVGSAPHGLFPIVEIVAAFKNESIRTYDDILGDRR